MLLHFHFLASTFEGVVDFFTGVEVLVGAEEVLGLFASLFAGVFAGTLAGEALVGALTGAFSFGFSEADFGTLEVRSDFYIVHTLRIDIGCLSIRFHRNVHREFQFRESAFY
jgi:hypothetical protein